MTFLDRFRAKPTAQYLAQQALAADRERRLALVGRPYAKRRAAALKPPKETGDAK